MWRLLWAAKSIGDADEVLVLAQAHRGEQESSSFSWTKAASGTGRSGCGRRRGDGHGVARGDQLVMAIERKAASPCGRG
jgi:hypothetical protein